MRTTTGEAPGWVKAQESGETFVQLGRWSDTQKYRIHVGDYARQSLIVSKAILIRRYLTPGAKQEPWTQPGGMEETWRAIPGYEDCYEVSSWGRVRSLERFVPHGAGGARRRVNERILKPVPRIGTRFFRVTLSCEGRRQRCYVHRLTAEAFGGAA